MFPLFMDVIQGHENKDQRQYDCNPDDDPGGNANPCCPAGLLPVTFT